MIPDPTFQNSIETVRSFFSNSIKIHFEFVIFEMLTQSKFLNFLKQFKKLSKLIFKNNYITSFLQIAKLEILPLLRSLTIKDNPILSAHLLKEFIVYRFPDLKEVVHFILFDL